MKERARWCDHTFRTFVNEFFMSVRKITSAIVQLWMATAVGSNTTDCLYATALCVQHMCSLQVSQQITPFSYVSTMHLDMLVVLLQLYVNTNE